MDITNIFSHLMITSFWGPFTAAIASGVILLLIGKVFSKGKQDKSVTLRHVQEVTIKHIIEIKEQANKITKPSTNNVSTRSSSHNNSDDPTSLLLIITVVGLSSVYAKHQMQVIATMSGAITFVLTFVLFTIFFSLKKNIVHDQIWNKYLYTTLFLTILGYLLMYLAVNPIYSELATDNQSINKHTNAFSGLYKIIFFVYQVIGFLTLAMAMLLQVLSLTFYAIAIHIAVNGYTPTPIFTFVSKLTHRFRNPKQVIIASSVLYIISFLFISGLLYQLVNPQSAS